MLQPGRWFFDSPFLQTGVDVMYLQPITRAYSNHKYDTSDYNEMDAAWFEKPKRMGAMKKPWLVRVYLGATQLYGEYNKPL